MSRTTPISANFTWDADLGDLQERLDAAVQRLEDATPLMEAIGAAIEGNVAIRFQTQTDPNGEAWAKLADSTLARYKAEDKGASKGSLLIREGDMFRSLTSNATADFAEIGFNSLVDGGDHQKSVLHEFGTKNADGSERMPRRGILLGDPEAGTLGATDLAEVQATVDDFLAELLNGP